MGFGLGFGLGLGRVRVTPRLLAASVIADAHDGHLGASDERDELLHAGRYRGDTGEI